MVSFRNCGSCACKNEYSSLFSIALVERLFVALALGRGRFKVDNAPSFNDLPEG